LRPPESPEDSGDILPPPVIPEKEALPPAARTIVSLVPSGLRPPESGGEAPVFTPVIPERERAAPPETPVIPERELPGLPLPPVIPERSLPAGAIVPPPVIKEPPSFYGRLPRIGRLEKGKYYIQLGILEGGKDSSGKYESLGQQFPMVIQEVSGDAAQKLMIGPLNEGESNAILLRLKSSGIKGAFIRHDG